ncbi:hypothetical protein, partial [Salmonella sp. s54395]|uniref:hypothetical protein n=1 Tax=Salmonella sp. s54395 TaxID=3159664 RepID=UPI00397FF987
HEAGAVVVTKSNQSRNIQSLMREGYEELNVKRALKISDGKLNLGRRLLKLAKEDKEMLSVIPGCKLFREQYIDEIGGELIVAGIHLLIPAGALPSGR